MNSVEQEAGQTQMQDATAGLAAALERLQGIVADDKRVEQIATLEKELADVRAQCAVLIKENSDLNAALEDAQQARAELESQQEAMSGRLDDAIDQIEEALKAG